MASTVFADRLSQKDILVFEVRPGIIKTDMTAKIKDKYDKLINEGLVPQKRWGLPEDIGKQWPLWHGAIGTFQPEWFSKSAAD